MSAAAGVRMKSPAHSGGFVKHEIIEPHGLLVTDTARILSVTRPALSALLNERATLSPEIALRLEQAFGVPMDTLMRMQNSYAIAQTGKRRARLPATPPTGYLRWIELRSNDGRQKEDLRRSKKCVVKKTRI